MLRANDQLDVLCLGKNFNLMRIFFFFWFLPFLLLKVKEIIIWLQSHLMCSHDYSWHFEVGSLCPWGFTWGHGDYESICLVLMINALRQGKYWEGCLACVHCPWNQRSGNTICGPDLAHCLVFVSKVLLEHSHTHSFTCWLWLGLPWWLRQ